MMNVTQSQENSKVPVTVYHITGPLNADEPLTGMAREAYQNGTRNILLDLTETTYISSAGLRAIQSMYNILRDKEESADMVNTGIRAGSYHSPHLKLCKPSKLVQEVLRVSGFEMFLEIHDSVKKGVESFG